MWKVRPYEAMYAPSDEVLTKCKTCRTCSKEHLNRVLSQTELQVKIH